MYDLLFNLVSSEHVCIRLLKIYITPAFIKNVRMNEWSPVIGDNIYIYIYKYIYIYI